MKRCVIVGGGEVKDLAYARQLIKEDDFIIAADRGYERCAAMQVKPLLLLGDFDSFTDTLPGDCPILTYPVEKDDTDTMLALKEAIERGFTELLLLGMCGGRIDHSIANIQALVYAAQRGVKARIMDEDVLITVLCDGESTTIPYREGFVISVFSYSPQCKGVTLRDLYYPLENGELDSSFPLGVSNHFLPEKDGFISIEEGTLLIISTREQ